MSAPTHAEQLLINLGVDQPKLIDLEAIAWCVGAEVRYARLDSCEARIIGFGERAIITVDPRRGAPRMRFSIGHELGHWHHHRGKSCICRSDEIGSAAQASHRERLADQFAADLLLPAYLFRAALSGVKRLTFGAVSELADTFQASRTATAMRVVDIGSQPAMLICHGLNGRRWFRRGPGVPQQWFPRADLDAASDAFETLHAGHERPQPKLIRASAWFDRQDALTHEVYEHTVRSGNGEVLTLLTFKGSGMLRSI